MKATDMIEYILFTKYSTVSGVHPRQFANNMPTTIIRQDYKRAVFPDPTTNKGDNGSY
jgi:hypothetical protein